jgi:hypothetical protein
MRLACAVIPLPIASLFGRRVKPAALKLRQVIAKSDPGKVMTEPGVMRWRECSGLIEAARRDIDPLRHIGVAVGQGRAAPGAEAAQDRFGGMKLARRTLREREARAGECDPGNDRRCRDAATRLAMADHAVVGATASAIAHGPTLAPTRYLELSHGIFLALKHNA